MKTEVPSLQEQNSLIIIDKNSGRAGITAYCGRCFQVRRMKDSLVIFFEFLSSTL